MVLLGGLVSGPLYDRGYLKYLIYVGAFGVVFGHMMLSLVSEFWQALLAQGFVVGLGAGMMFTPGVTVLQSYFSTKIGLATGLAAAGSSFGGVIYPIVFYRLIDRIGYGWSVRVIGFIALATLMVPMVFLKQRTKSGKVRALVDVSAFTDGPYVLFTFGTFVGFIGLYVMLFYLSFFGLDTGATDPAMAFYIVPILNAASMFGRTLPNWLSDKVGPFNILIPGSLVCGALTLAMMGVKGLGVSLCFAFSWQSLWRDFANCCLRAGNHRRRYPLWLLLRRLHRPSDRLLHRSHQGQVPPRQQNRPGLCLPRSRYPHRRSRHRRDPTTDWS